MQNEQLLGQCVQNCPDPGVTLTLSGEPHAVALLLLPTGLEVADRKMAWMFPGLIHQKGLRQLQERQNSWGGSQRVTVNRMVV